MRMMGSADLERMLAAAACAVVAIAIPFLKKLITSSSSHVMLPFTDHIHRAKGRRTNWAVDGNSTVGGLPLPAGSMGLPCIGESLSLSLHRHKFWISRQHKYGDVYKTHLFGYPSIVVAGPEAARFVMVDQARSFERRGLPIVEKLLGPTFFGYQQEKIHANLKTIFHNIFLPDALERSIPVVEGIAIDCIKDWDGKTINTLEESRKYVFKVAMEFVVGAAPEEEKEELRRACEDLMKGVNSLGLYVLGTRYYRAIKESRKKVCEVLDKIMSLRKVFRNEQAEDVLGVMMRLEDEDGVQMSKEEMYDNVLTILHAAYDSSAAALCWAIKFLTHHPQLLASIQDEHATINSKKGCQEENITWYDIRERMQLSLRVIKETLRLTNVVEFSYREAMEDVPYEGIVFPKGWRVIVAHVAYHMNSDYFPWPEEFDASRFRIQPKLFSFTPFGSGPHGCMGRELLHLQILVFLHHLVLTYSWEPSGNDEGSEFIPTHVPKGGFPIHVKHR